jgi:putative FmdB family regulatory protein
MPIYEYQCDACGKRTEILQKLDDPPLASCPDCGAAVRKLLSAPAFQFKGSGWYVTDYAGKKPAAGGGKTSEGAGAGTKSETASSSEAASSPTKPAGGGES